jgi:hypothetical protein
MKVVELLVSQVTMLGCYSWTHQWHYSAGVAATFPTVSVVRAFVGSLLQFLIMMVQMFRSTEVLFNIVGNEVWFTDPPKGNTRTRRNEQ